jgi:hypothetical protein
MAKEADPLSDEAATGPSEVACPDGSLPQLPNRRSNATQTNINRYDLHRFLLKIVNSVIVVSTEAIGIIKFPGQLSGRGCQQRSFSHGLLKRSRCNKSEWTQLALPGFTLPQNDSPL